MRDGRKKVPIIPQNMICYNSKSGFGARGALRKRQMSLHYHDLYYVNSTS